MKLQCDSCHKTLSVSEIAFVEPISNIHMHPGLGMTFVFADKDGNAMGGYDQADPDKGEQNLACPHCGCVHLFGFDQVPQGD